MTLRFTPKARRQFLAGLAFIAEDSPSAARDFADRVAKALRRLKRFPESGRKLPEFPELPHREVIVAPYRFFYRRKGDVVWVVAAWHGAQQPSRPSTKLV